MESTYPPVPRVNYRRGIKQAKRLAIYLPAIRNRSKGLTLNQTQKAIVRACRKQVTAREAECLELYYVQQLNYRQISNQLHINVSTISRNIARGEEKITDVFALVKALTGQEVELLGDS